jgi:hypothetical protein
MPGAIVQITVNDAFHANVRMPPNSQSGNEIYFDPNGHTETDNPIPALPRPQWLDDDNGEESKENIGDSSHDLSSRYAALNAENGGEPILRADDGPPPRPLFSLKTGDPLSDLSESEPGSQAWPNIGTQSSQESQDDTFSGITGGKKTKTNKKSKKRTRKHRKILNQVKKLLKEI